MTATFIPVGSKLNADSVRRAFDLRPEHVAQLCEAVSSGGVVFPRMPLSMYRGRAEGRRTVLAGWLRHSGVPAEWVDRLCATLRPGVTYLSYYDRSGELAVVTE